MNRVTLLETIKDFIETVTKDLIMPVRVQSINEEESSRAPEVYMMRLPDNKSATKKAPYALINLLSGDDFQEPGQQDESKCITRIILCTYNEDEQEGGLMLLNFAERIRIGLLKLCVIGEHGEFEVDKKEGVHFLVYQDDTAPYYAGEMIITWKMPFIEREVPEVWGENLKNPWPW